MSRGVLHPSTMAAGLLYRAAGVGFRDRWLYVQSTRRLWLLSSVAEDSASELVLDLLRSDGSHSDHRKFSFPGIFFFQAEDGIRALYVTGVQTCALPI